MTDRVQSARLQAETAEAFAAHQHATTKLIARNLRAAAAELDQLHPETDTPRERREKTAQCLRKLRESVWMLESIDHSA